MSALFNGTLYFVQVAFTDKNPPNAYNVVSFADMQTAIAYATQAVVPISLYASQYGANTVSVNSQVINYDYQIDGASVSDDQLRDIVNDVASHLPDDACVVVLLPPAIDNSTNSRSAGTGGYHDYANVPYINAFISNDKQGSTSLTIKDTTFRYAGGLSHEIAEMIVDPQVDGKPEVCDPCGPNYVSTYLSYFDDGGNYIATTQKTPYDPTLGFNFAFYVNGVVKPEFAQPKAAPSEACSYSPAIASREFDVRFYLNRYGDLKSTFGTNYTAATRHWLNQGLPVEGRRGSREFDVQFYLGLYPDLKGAFGTDYKAAADHWLTQGLPVEGRRGSREFDVQFYLRRYSDLQKAFGANFTAAIDHWLNLGLSTEGRRGSREFDVQFYLGQYPDLKTAFGTNYKAAMDHWIAQGLPAEGRAGAREVDVSYYLANYADLNAAFGTNRQSALDHWITQGLPREGRRGSLEFDVRYYLATYPDLETAFGNNFVAAFDHWVSNGILEGRKGAP